MTTLADLTRQTARLVTRTVIGSTTAVSGNATTLIDTVNLAGFPDDNFNNGTVWITSGANAGRSRTITDFSDTADRVTCAAFPNNVLSGIDFEVAAADFVEYRDLRQAVNLALREIGKIFGFDETTLAVAEQLVYDLPAGVSRVKAIEVVTDIGLGSEYAELNTHFDEVDGEIRFEQNRGPADGLTLRLIYEKFHGELVDDTDELNYQVDDECLVYMAARQAMRLAYKRFGKAGSETIPEWLNEAAEEAKRHVKPNIHKPFVRVRTA